MIKIIKLQSVSFLLRVNTSPWQPFELLLNSLFSSSYAMSVDNFSR
jgi:hypothetical protein